MQSILMHHKEKHVNQFIKVRQPVLCPITGILKEQTKQYPFKYASLGDQEDIIFDTVSNTVRHTKHSSTSLQLSLCGSEQNETINNGMNDKVEEAMEIEFDEEERFRSFNQHFTRCPSNIERFRPHI